MSAADTEEEIPVGLACALDGFTDADYVKETIRRLAAEDIKVDSTEFDTIYEKFKTVIDQYHEQPHLMDKELPTIMKQCIDILYANPPTSDRFRGTCRLLCLITKTRGYKVVRNLFPHEVPDIEKVLGYMSAQELDDCANWETQYILLLWLSILATVPFTLARFDGTGDQETVTERILNICRTFVRSRLKCNVIAAYMTGCFLSRPDIHGRYMRPYLFWVEEELAACQDPTKEFVRVAILLSACSIFKMAKREVLQEHSAAALTIALKCASSSQEFERKLALKLLQRIGLCQLSPNLAPWRYLMKKRGLLGKSLVEGADAQDDQCDDLEVPEIMEQIIDPLLTGLGDRVLIVRWSAAKGMARIASRLPKSFAIEVVNSVFGIFEEKDREGLWQGGCMALAELGRRGVLLPVHLPEVVEILLQAFVYDELRGSYSVGSTVRDTACYLAWTLGRSYEPAVVKPFVNELATQLLCLACFDREVNVRRAASAAFQECVGRLGNFPNGIDLVCIADYVSVGKRSRAFLDVGVEVASYKEYTHPLIVHLIYRKVSHWDRAVRDLAAETLGRLASGNPDHFTSKIFEELLEYAVCIDIHMRLGSLLALGQITLALSQRETPIPEDISKSLLSLFDTYEQKRYLSSSMSAQTLGNFAQMISCLAKSQFTCFPSDVIDKWWTVGQRCLESPESTIQVQGAKCISALLEFSVPTDGDKSRSLVQRCCQNLHSDKEEIRCGYARLLRYFDPVLISRNEFVLFESLKRATMSQSHVHVESRKESLISLEKIVCTAVLKTSPNAEQYLRDLLVCITTASEDYSLSETFFDVGLQCRLAAMTVFKDLMIHMSKEDRLSMLEGELVNDIIRRIVSQTADAQRASEETAISVLTELLRVSPSKVSHSKELTEALKMDDRIDTLAFILVCDDYRPSLLTQLLISMGAKTEKEATKAQLACLKYLQGVQDDRAALTEFVTTLSKVVELPLFVKNRFLFPPLVRGIGRLLNTGALANAPSEKLVPMIDFVWKNIQRTKDVNRILSSVETLCEMLQFEETAKTSLKRLSVLLGHKHFPQVRMQTARKLYETLLMYSAVVPEKNFEVVLTLLSNSEWVNDSESVFEEIKTARNLFCDLVDIPKPMIAKASK